MCIPPLGPFTMPHARCRIHLYQCECAANLMLPMSSHLRMVFTHFWLHIHAAAFTPPHSLAPMQQCPQSSSYAAALTRQHFFAALMLQHWCNSSHAAEYTQHLTGFTMIKFFPSKIKPLPTFRSNCLDGISFCPDGVAFCSLGGEVLKTFSVGHGFQLFSTIQGK